MNSWQAEPRTESPANPAAVFDVCGATHRGLVRERNEDAWLADAGLGLAVVADGLGGHADGGLASREVVDCMADYLRRVLASLLRAPMPERNEAVQQKAVARGIALAHKTLKDANGGLVDSRFCRGSTVAGLWAPPFPDAPATIFHVGDSRLYLQREHTLTALTRDHSAYERWVEGGKLGPAPPKNQILQALGVSEHVEPTIASFQPRCGDSVLLCTDGLTGGVQDDALSAVLERPASLRAKCDELLERGLAAGGKDNLTIVLCAFLQSRGDR